MFTFKYTVQPIFPFKNGNSFTLWGEILCRESALSSFDIMAWREWYCQIERIINHHSRFYGFDRFSLNIDSFQLFDPVILECLKKLEGYPIVLEWTEEKYLLSDEDVEEAGLHFQEICKEFNFIPALDDVGRGEDSIRRSFLVEPKIVKIDGAVFQGSKLNKYKQKMFINYIKFYQSMNVGIVLEWIESFEDVLFAESIGVDFGQGFYFLNKDKEYQIVKEEKS